MTSIMKWVQRNRFEFILLLSILFTGAFLRLLRIGEYMIFLGDEGRDALIVYRLLTDFDPILIGPGTSVGDLYLGPMYYYFIAPGLLLSNFSPVGPSIQIAIFGLVTVALVWYIGREWFGKWGGLVAALLYSISPTVVDFSRSSWNPNIMPLLSLVCVYALWRTWKYLEYQWLIVLGIFYAFVLQSHYLGLILAPLIFIFWILSFKNAKYRKRFLQFTLIGLVIFAVLMSPLLLFDIRHGWINYNGIKDLIFGDDVGSSSFRVNFIPYLFDTLNVVATRLLGARESTLGAYAAALLVGSTLLLLRAFKQPFSNDHRSPYFLLICWLWVSILGLSFYSNEIYDHYMGFLFPTPFLIFGGISQLLINKAKIRGSWIVLTVLIFLVFFSIKNSHLHFQPNGQLQRTEKVAGKIGEESRGNPFNFALIAENNYDDAYLFFFEKEDDNVVLIDSQRWEETVTDQLFVVCELENKNECDPTHNAKAQVANFGWSKIDDQWDVEGVRIYKLSHVQPEE